MKELGPAGKNLGSPTYTAARTAFDKNDGTVAMSFSGLYQEARMKASNPNFYNSKDWMVVPFPQWKDSKRKVTANYSAHYYMVNAESDKLVQQASWILVGWMLSHGEEYLEKVAIIQPTKKLIESPIYKSNLAERDHSECDGWRCRSKGGLRKIAQKRSGSSRFCRLNLFFVQRPK